MVSIAKFTPTFHSVLSSDQDYLEMFEQALGVYFYSLWLQLELIGNGRSIFGSIQSGLIWVQK